MAEVTITAKRMQSGARKGYYMCRITRPERPTVADLQIAWGDLTASSVWPRPDMGGFGAAASALRRLNHETDMAIDRLLRHLGGS